MTAKAAFKIVLLWAITFGCVGAVIGATLGAFVPEYYRSIFRHGDSPNFHPLQVGIGLGTTQGIASGVAISIAVLVQLAWRDVRAARPATGKDPQHNIQHSRSWTVHALWGVVTTMSVVLVGAITFILGGIIGQQQLYQSWTDLKLDKLATILESTEFTGVDTDYSSAAQVYLTGAVKDSGAHDALHDKLVFTFGTEEADEMIRSVDIAR